MAGFPRPTLRQELNDGSSLGGVVLREFDLFSGWLKGYLRGAGFDEQGNFTGATTTSGLNELTGDVTAGPGTGAQAATIPSNTVTYAKMQDVTAASKLIGRGSASGSGDPQEITVGAGLNMSGTTLIAFGVPFIVTLDLTNTQMVGMGVTPVNIVGAPGSGFVNVLVQFTMVTNLSVAYTQASDIFVRYGGDTTNLNDQNSFTSQQTGGYVTHHTIKNIATALSIFENKALQAYWNVSSGGDAANTAKLYAVYYTMPIA